MVYFLTNKAHKRYLGAVKARLSCSDIFLIKSQRNYQKIITSAVVANQTIDIIQINSMNNWRSWQACLYPCWWCYRNFSKLLIKTVNSDAFATARSVIHRVAGIQKLYTEYGLRKSFRYIPVHQTIFPIETVHCEAFPILHLLVVVTQHNYCLYFLQISCKFLIW